MTSHMRNGLVVGALHMAIVSSLGASLLVDRATRPRVWARAAPVDPNMPIRGRYVSLRVEAEIGPGLSLETGSKSVTLAVQENHLVALPTTERGTPTAMIGARDGRPIAVLWAPLAYFIPEHAIDPSRRPADEELWVEVTIPSSGAPRPIRLGVRKNGVLLPIDLN